ncbi:MAG: RimK family alpha-L-glutamate ligase [Gammaproteobacteria bacterium]
MTGHKIAIITDDPGWHGRQLQQALAAQRIGCEFLSLTDCRLEPGRQPLDVIMPGFRQVLPAAVFVRGVPGGRLEQVILRLDILHALAGLGIPVYNGPRIIERTVDKALTSLLLSRAGLPGPPTWVCESLSQAQAIWRREIAAGHKLVGKPLFGSQGEGLCLLDEHSQLAPLAAHWGGVFYLQRYVERGAQEWSDIRVFVIDDQAVAAMTRFGQHWITNRAQGARCEVLPLNAELSDLAVAAARAVDADYAGVDLMYDANGKLQIIEVNGIPAWWGLQQVSGINIGERLIASLLARLPQQPGAALTLVSA